MCVCVCVWCVCVCVCVCVCKLGYFLKDLLMTKKFKRIAFIWHRNLLYIINILPVTFDQFNASFMNKSIHFFKKKKKTYRPHIVMYKFNLLGLRAKHPKNVCFAKKKKTDKSFLNKWNMIAWCTVNNEIYAYFDAFLWCNHMLIFYNTDIININILVALYFTVSVLTCTYNVLT